MTGSEFDLEVHSGSLHLQRFGSPSAPLVLGLPGLSGNIKNFDYVGERIVGASFQLVVVELRGRGRSATTGPGTYGWDNHARDVSAVADSLGVDRFALIGMSMGGSVAMKMAQLDGARLSMVVLIDVAGRVDRGVGAVVASALDRVRHVFASADEYVEAVKRQGLIEPWNEYWDRAYRYELEVVAAGVRCRTSAEAVDEDRAYSSTQHPYDRWKSLTMPTLLLRASREFLRGSGYVVPEDDRDRFQRDVPQATVVDVDANHLTITTHLAVSEEIKNFLDSSVAFRTCVRKVGGTS
jgi:pimeloyl-ACP methyl ester carboxylesterase